MGNLLPCMGRVTVAFPPPFNLAAMGTITRRFLATTHMQGDLEHQSIRTMLQQEGLTRHLEASAGVVRLKSLRRPMHPRLPTPGGVSELNKLNRGRVGRGTR